MEDRAELTEFRRALLERYLQGDAPGRATRPDGISRRAPETLVPLSFAQEQMWLLAQLAPDVPLYNQCVTLRMSGALDVPALERSLNEILLRHEAWRTSFPLVDGTPMQIVHPEAVLALPVLDLRPLPWAERATEALQRATEAARRPFDLERGPLLRAILMRLADAEYKLFLTLHHIIFDGVSLYRIFLPELAALYEECARGGAGAAPVLPPLPIQYADFSLWHCGWLADGAYADQLAYWQGQLADAPGHLRLPADRPRPPTPSFQGAVHPLSLSAELSAALRALSRRENVSLFMTLLAALVALLSRYSGQEDLLVGTPVAGRPRPETEGLLGVFINTLVLRPDLAGDPPFRALLRRAREVTLEALAHQDVPFERVVRALNPERRPGQNPLFQVLLTLEPPLPALPPGWSVTLREVATHTAKVDLSLELEDREEGVAGWFEYSTDLFEPNTIARLAGHWQTLLAGAVADPDRRISALPLLTPAERAYVFCRHEADPPATPAMLDAPQGPGRADVGVRGLHRAFEAQAARTPEAVAVVDGTGALTYAALNRRANRLAHALQRRGVGLEVPVGVWLERSRALVVGALGILKAGGAYVPLDPDWPAERVAWVLADAGVRTMVSQRALRGRLPTGAEGPALAWVELDTEGSDAEGLDAESAADLTKDQNLPVVEGEDGTHLAYVIYTSGSAGIPKGVAVEHRNVLRLFESTHGWFHFDERDVWTLFHSFAFDFSVWELWGALLHGGRLVVVSREASRSPEVFYDLVRREGVTVLNQTPAAFRQVMRADEAANSPRDLALRLLIFGGEALETRSLAPWFARHGDERPQLVNMYGITETTVHVTYRPLTIADLDLAAKSVIGRPIPDLQLYVLDAHLEPTPVGVPGELYVGGAGLARGYLNRPELTAERFIPHTFSPEPGARLYRSGDLARRLPSGDLEYLGRADQQVKIRGFRIEPSEIEAALCRHPSVREALVVPREDTPGEQRLVAYVVPCPGRAVVSRELRRALKSSLPDFMVPAAFVALDSLPLTPNGKIDRRALPAPGHEWSGREPPTAPSLPLHSQLIPIWEELLGVRPIGIRDDFFDLGGHSLLAVRLVGRIKEVCGQQLPLATLFGGATIERVADALLEQESRASRSPVVRVQDAGPRRPFFFLHGDWNGGGFYCKELARDLGHDQPFIVLDPQGLCEAEVPLALEAMSAMLVKSLQSVQPEGPYLLGGFCAGGLLAYEMARQLCAAGETVDLLALVDTAAARPRARALHGALTWLGALARRPTAERLRWFLRLQRVDSLVEHGLRRLRRASRGLWRELTASGVTGFPLRARLRVSEGAHDIVQKLWALRAAPTHSQACVAPPRQDIQPPRGETRDQDWMAIYSWIAAGYTARRYPGKVTLIWARDELQDGRDPTDRWRAVAGDVTVRVVPGTHLTCITTHVHALAAQLSACLGDTRPERLAR